MAALIVQNGKHKGTKIPIPNREVSVGRDDKCYVRLTSSDVSRVHCTLNPTPEGVLVKDSGSQNGVIVNGDKIAGSHVLRPGDLLKIGPVMFTVEVPKPTQLRDPSVDDDSIASWLAEGDTGAKASDTTEIRTVQQSQAAEEPPPPPAEEPVEFKTIAEEAQDIIRRHFESKSRK